MKAQLQQFQNEEFGSLEILMIDGNPNFPATECAAILGYSNPQKAVRDHCREDGCTNRSVIDRLGREQKKRYINEGNLYRLIIRSKLPAAVRFEKWIFDEVLPSIRKYGAYITDEILEEAIRSQEFAFELLQKLQAEKAKIAALLDKVETLAPKARYYDLVLQSKGVVQVSVIAKDYGMSAVAFNRLLHDLKIQYRVGCTWVLYQRFADKGYTKSRTYYTASGECIIHTYWTQAGRLFLYNALGVSGILPLMEIEDAADSTFGEVYH